MKSIRFTFILLLTIPVLGYGQLKKDLEKPNISSTLETSAYNNSLLGFLDPSRMQMQHSISMAYVSVGGIDMVLNTYLNTMQYKFSDNLFLTTRLGIMTSPYNSLPGENALSESQIFGGAEIRYFPSKNTVISFSFESTPYYYNRDSFYNMSNRFGALGN